MAAVHSSLPAVADADLGALLVPGSGLVALDFTADWCPPCRMMAPVLDAAAQEFEGRVRLFQIDADANPAAMLRYGVRGLPTLLVLRDGEPVDRIIGAVPLATLRARLAALAAA